jgi:hypothetical protein
MDDYESLSHSKWECKYHVVFIPKYRRMTLYGELRQHLGEVFRKLAMQKEAGSRKGTCVHVVVCSYRVSGMASVFEFIYSSSSSNPSFRSYRESYLPITVAEA